MVSALQDSVAQPLNDCPFRVDSPGSLVRSDTLESCRPASFYCGSRPISVFSAGTSIYYREDGVRFSRRQSGDEFVGNWSLDENGLICEDIRGGESTFCLGTDSEEFTVTRHPESETYYYSEIGFSSPLTISTGDRLGLASQ